MRASMRDLCRLLRHASCMRARLMPAISLAPSTITESCPLLSLLRSSPWPLSVAEIAMVLEVDEETAVMALRLLRQVGKATLKGCLWEIS